MKGLIVGIFLCIILGGAWGLLMAMLFERPLSTIFAILGGFVLGRLIAKLYF